MRTDLELIYDWVPQGAHILDLACGDGVLLERLAQEKGVTGYGLEIDPDGITQCVARGVNVIEHNLDDGLSSFCDNSYDQVIMTQALQALRDRRQGAVADMQHQVVRHHDVFVGFDNRQSGGDAGQELPDLPGLRRDRPGIRDDVQGDEQGRAVCHLRRRR